MAKYLVSIALLLFTAAATPHPQRVLFVGNSLTYVNDLPAMLETVARSRGVPMRTAFSGDGGMTLRAHWEKGDAETAIESGHFDFVVLQPQSSEAVWGAAEMRRYAQLFADDIRRSGAKCVLFLTWTPQPWNGKQSETTRTLLAVARQIHAVAAPVGIAWTNVAAHDVKLYADDVHPTVAGTYLAACVFFATISGESPEGAAHPPQIDDATASMIQKEAWVTARRWR